MTTALAPAAGDARPADRPSLIGLDRDELGQALAAIGVAEKQRRMRVQQLWHWLYVRGVADFSAMSNIARELREALDAHFTVARPEIVEEQVSADGTRKWLFRFPPRGAGRPVWHRGRPCRPAERQRCRCPAHKTRE